MLATLLQHVSLRQLEHFFFYLAGNIYCPYVRWAARRLGGLAIQSRREGRAISRLAQPAVEHGSLNAKTGH